MEKSYNGTLGQFTYDDSKFQVVCKIDKGGHQLYLSYIGNESQGENIHIPYGVEDISNMFMNNHTLVSAPAIPKTVKKSNSTFAHCLNLELSSAIPESIIEHDNMFEDCPKLRRLPIFPEVVCEIDDSLSETSISTQ